ncbi:hypothetical protein Tco_1022372 [Tanacetum coccineum]
MGCSCRLTCDVDGFKLLYLLFEQGLFQDNYNCLSNKGKRQWEKIGKQEDSKALVTIDGEGVDWTSHSEDEQENYAFMACNSSGSDTEREQLGDARKEIQAYTQAFKKVENTISCSSQQGHML